MGKFKDKGRIFATWRARTSLLSRLETEGGFSKNEKIKDGGVESE